MKKNLNKKLFTRMLYCFCLFLLCTSCVKQEKKEVYAIPDYRSWKRPVDKILTVDFPDHENTFRLVYANDIAFDSIFAPDNYGKIGIIKKEGAIIVKETYASMEDLKAQKPLFVTFMIKDAKSSFSKNGWVSAKQFLNSDTAQYITTQYCIGCHEAANESHPYFDGNVDEIFRDYLFLDIGN